MSIVKLNTIENSNLAAKKVIMFGSAVDLAHIFNKEWAINNLLLSNNTDRALLFIHQEITNRNKDKNFFQKFIFKMKIKKARKALNLFIRELRDLVNEIEALVGFNTYLREGKKSKIKNKKVFDDFVAERREIAIMLQGLLLFLETEKASDIDFSNEIIIMNEIMKETSNVAGLNNLGYFTSICIFLNTFDF